MSAEGKKRQEKKGKGESGTFSVLCVLLGLMHFLMLRIINRSSFSKAQVNKILKRRYTRLKVENNCYLYKAMKNFVKSHKTEPHSSK